MASSRSVFSPSPVVTKRRSVLTKSTHNTRSTNTSGYNSSSSSQSCSRVVNKTLFGGAGMGKTKQNLGPNDEEFDDSLTQSLSQTFSTEKQDNSRLTTAESSPEPEQSIKITDTR